MSTKQYAPDFWNERYSRPDFVYGEMPNAYLERKWQGLTPGKALFPAEGEGRNAVFAAKSGWTVSAFDQSEAAKKKAELLAGKNGVKIDYTISDVDRVYYPENSFDAMVLVFAHFHSDNRRDYHRKLSAFLKSGGILVMEAFSKKQLRHQQEHLNAGGPRAVRMLYDLAELKLDFQGFEWLECYETETVLNEGQHHIGNASVIRMYGVKR